MIKLEDLKLGQTVYFVELGGDSYLQGLVTDPLPPSPFGYVSVFNEQDLSKELIPQHELYATKQDVLQHISRTKWMAYKSLKIASDKALQIYEEAYNNYYNEATKNS